MPTPNLVAVDGDGVLLNYNKVYPRVWRAAFGTDLPRVRDNCYHAHHEYGAVFADAEHKKKFFDCFDHAIWASMEALPGAVEAVNLLKAAGKRIVCVSSMPAEFANARHANLLQLGFPIDAVVATGRVDDGTNPKLQALLALRPEAFADDLLQNFVDLPAFIHRAWIDYANVDSPNMGKENKGWHSSRHGTLLDFAKAWVGSANGSSSLRPRFVRDAVTGEALGA